MAGCAPRHAPLQPKRSLLHPAAGSSSPGWQPQSPPSLPGALPCSPSCPAASMFRWPQEHQGRGKGWSRGKKGTAREQGQGKLAGRAGGHLLSPPSLPKRLVSWRAEGRMYFISTRQKVLYPSLGVKMRQYNLNKCSSL